MDIIIARTYKNEMQKKIAELLKEFEKTTKMGAVRINLVRQSITDSLGNEVDFNYAVETEIHL